MVLARCHRWTNRCGRDVGRLPPLKSLIQSVSELFCVEELTLTMTGQLRYRIAAGALLCATVGAQQDVLSFVNPLIGTADGGTLKQAFKRAFIVLTSLGHVFAGATLPL